MSVQMKITLVSQNYLPFIGGIETHAQQVAHELKKRGHHVQIMAVNFEHSKLPEKLKVLHESLLAPSYRDYDDEGIPVHALTPTLTERLCLIPTIAQVAPVLRRHLYHQLRDWSHFWYRIAYLRRIRQILRGSDVVHSLTYGLLGWTTQQAARELKIPFVCTPFVHPHQWGDGAKDIAYYKRAQAVIGLVETDTQYLASLGVSADALHTIGVSPALPPTSNPEEFRRRHKIGGAPFILYVGRMMPQKGAEAVVKAASIMWEHNPDLHFVFIGPASPDSENWFADMDPRMHYLGRTSNEEKADALAACDIFCMPSMSEILPTVYLEAWSFEKPVVGGHAHGLVNLVEGNQAGLCSSQQPHELAEVLKSLLDDAPRRRQFGINGSNLVKRLYSPEAVASQLEALYTSVLSKAPLK